MLILGLSLTVSVVAVCAIYAMNRIDEEIRGFVEQKLRSHYTGLSINVRSARRVEGKGIEIRDLSIVEPSGDIGSATLVQIDEILIACQADLSHLLSGSIQPDQIIIRRLRLQATRGANGTWSTAQLFPLPKFGESKAPVILEDAVIELTDKASGRRENVHLMRLRLEPVADAYQVRTVVEFSGAAQSDLFTKLEFKGRADPAHLTWNIEGQAFGVSISSADLQPWRDQLAGVLPADATFQINSECAFRAASAASPEEEISFALAGRLTAGRLQDRRLPAPLTQLQGEYYLDNRVAKLQAFEAQSGAAEIRMDVKCDDWKKRGPTTIDLSATNLELNNAIRNALPPDKQATWDKFQPRGKIDANVRLEFDGTSWRPTVAVQLRQTSFAYDAFPYRVDRASGELQLNGDLLTFNTLAMAEQTPVAIQGEIRNPGPNATGWIDINTQQPAPLTEKLFAALKPEHREVLRKFSPSGMLTFSGRITCCGLNKRPEKHFRVGVRDGFIQFAHFPYPLRQLSGVFEINDDRWTFHDLEARNGSGLIKCHGTFQPANIGQPVNNGQPAGVGGYQLVMHFDCSNVPLAEELRNALSPNAGKLWTDLRPRGTLDQLKIELVYDTRPRKLSLDIVAQKWPETPPRPERSLAIVPVWFPYHMDNLTGWVHYRDGIVEVKNVRASHGDARLTTNGAARVNPDGSWSVSLRELHADRLRNDHDLVSALPAPLGEAVLKLNLKGPLWVQGGLEFSGGPTRPFQSNWDLDFDFENGSLQCGIDLDHIHGGIRLKGGGQGGEFYSRGELEVDSLIYNGVQVSHISGPVVIDASRITFGAWTPQLDNVAPHRLSADVFEGKLQGDASISLQGAGGFALQANLTAGNLEVFSREMMPGSQKISGDAQAFIRMSGQGGTHTIRGVGSVQLRHADIYELPAMVKLLKTLRFRPPDATAFDSSDIEFRIVGEQIYLDRLDFAGDAISLQGKGEMDTQRSINLYFKTLVGRDHNPLVRWVLGEASGQLLLIHVDRTLDNPRFTQEPLPGLNKALQQIFPETHNNQPASAESRTTTRRNRF